MMKHITLLFPKVFSNSSGTVFEFGVTDGDILIFSQFKSNEYWLSKVFIEKQCMQTMKNVVKHKQIQTYRFTGGLKKFWSV